MSAYSDGRDKESLNRLDAQISAFIADYNANPTDAHTTIFLFPGGIGSQLVRAKEPSQNGPPFSYDALWLDWWALALGAAIDLQMIGDKDYQQRYVLPDGCVDTICLRPYGGFVQWCQDSFIDLFVFGWDWRRGAADSAKFFLKSFLPRFEKRAQACVPPPLDNFWLIGHSFGGMVAKQILRHPSNKYVRKLKGAITVDTPFYGYGGQVHRFFKGDSQLNWTEGASGATIVTKVISTLAAGYELLFLDGPSYDANKTAFAQDPDGYDLTGYPSMDATTAGLRADPYNPNPGEPKKKGASGNVRYTSNCGFDWSLLSAGDAASCQAGQSLDASVAGKFWNIRGVQTTNGVDADDTVVSQTWRLVPPSFSPDRDADPIKDSYGPGDGTLPAWSTRLLGNANVCTVKGEDIEHMELMNHAKVQAAIAKILQPAPDALQRMLTTAKTVKMKTARREELNTLIDQLREVESRKDLPPKERKSAIREVLRKASGDDPNKLRELFARAYLDALKSPNQISGPLRGAKGRGKPKGKPER